MSVGEVAEVRCAPGWAWSRNVTLPPDEGILYEVELLGTRDGPVLAEPSLEDVMTEEDAAALMRQFESLREQAPKGVALPESVEGHVPVGDTFARWKEASSEVTLWLPVDSGLRARDITVTFTPKSLCVSAGSLELTHQPLRGRIDGESSWWAFDDDEPVELEGGRALQIVLHKADKSVWAGIFQ